MVAVTRSRWTILSASYLVVLSISLPYIGWTPMLTAIAHDLSLSYTEAGTLASVTALTGGTMLILGGVLVARWGCKNVILLGLATAVVGQLVFAYAGSYAMALVARVIVGVAIGLLFVGPYTMAVDWFRESRRTGIAVGVMLSGDGIGKLLSLFLFAMVLTILGWRNGIASSALYLAALFVVALLVLQNAPGADAARAAAGRPDRPGFRAASRILRALLHRNVLFAMTFYMGAWGLFALLASWMPTILMEEAGWSQSWAGLYTSFFSLAGIITSLVFGYLSDRVGRRKVFILLAGAVVTVLVGALSIALSAGNHPLVVALLPLIGLSVYAGTPLSLALATESVGRGEAGTVNGVVLGGAFLLGGFIYPFALGGIKDLTGSFIGGFFGVTVATFVLCFLAPLFGRDVEQPVRRQAPELDDQPAT